MIRKGIVRVADLVQWLRTLAALPGDHGLIAAFIWLCTVICNSSLRESDGTRHPCGAQTYMWKYSLTHK